MCIHMSAEVCMYLSTLAHAQSNKEIIFENKQLMQKSILKLKMDEYII